MKTFKCFSLIVAILTFCTLLSCKRDADTIPANNNGQVVNPSPVHASVSGNVIDENDHAVVGATVRSGNHSTITDNRGLFRFDNIEMDKYASVVFVEVNSYFRSVRTFPAAEGSSNFIKIKLIPKALTGTVDASTGGAVTLPNNSVVTLEANSVVIKSNGQAYTGNINIYAADIDPTAADISAIIPGSFQATDANNYRVLLKSYGMMAVQLEGQSGELLQIANGKTAKLRFAIPSSLSSTAAASIPLWSLNETDGLWKEEGQATKTGNYYEGDVAHFSFWNCDQPMEAIYLELTLNTAGTALPGTLVKITRVSNGASSYGFTDSTGHVGGMVFSNEALLLEVLSDCNETIYSQNIGPFNQNSNLGTIAINVPSQFIITVSGNAVDCNAAPVTNGNAFIFSGGQRFTTPVNNGNFSLNITRCSTTSAPVEIIVADNTSQQQSTAWTSTVSPGNINTGTLIACGISTLEYINFTIDGTNYSLDGQSDVLSISNSNNYAVIIQGIDPQGYNITFGVDFTNIAPMSSQPLVQFISSLIDYSYCCNTVAPSTMVSISEYGNIGEFISGSFSTIITSAVAPTTGTNYNVTCSFRIKRVF